MGVEESTAISILYASLLTIFLITTGYIASKRLHNINLLKTKETNSQTWNELKFGQQIEEWMRLAYRLRNVYLSGLIHIYDTSTDIIIIIQFFKLTNEQRQWTKESDKKYPNNKLNMLGLAISSLIAFTLYRIISGYLVYKYTQKYHRFFIQFFDLDLFRTIYIAHHLERESVIDLQRWLQKLEAIFESAPQAILQIVYLTLSDDNINLSGNSVIITVSLLFSLVSISQRFTNDDKVFFEDDKGALANIQWGNFCLWNKNFISMEFITRYLFRVTDVFSRIVILSLIWIIFPSGGYWLMCLLLTESVIILLWVKYTGEYNKLQLLVATYFAEYVEIKDDKSGEKTTQNIESTKLRSAKFAFWRRIEHLVLLVICIGRVLFDNTFFRHEKWVTTSKILLLLGIISNSLSGALYFFTHHNMTNDLKSTTGTNERDILKVIENKDEKTFLEMLLFGFDINIEPMEIISDIEMDEKKENNGETRISQLSMESSVLELYGEKHNTPMDDIVIKYVDEKDKSFEDNIELQEVKLDNEIVNIVSNDKGVKNVEYMKLDIRNIFLLFCWEFRHKIIAYKEECLIIKFAFKQIHFSLEDIKLLLGYYIPSSVEGLEFLFGKINAQIQLRNSSWKDCFNFEKQKRLFGKFSNKCENIRNKILEFYLECCRNEHIYSLYFSDELLNAINDNSIFNEKINKNLKITYDENGIVSSNIDITKLISEYISVHNTESTIMHCTEENKVIYLNKRKQPLDIKVNNDRIVNFNVIKSNKKVVYIYITVQYKFGRYTLGSGSCGFKCMDKNRQNLSIDVDKIEIDLPKQPTPNFELFEESQIKQLYNHINLQQQDINENKNENYYKPQNNSIEELWGKNSKIISQEGSKKQVLIQWKFVTSNNTPHIIELLHTQDKTGITKRILWVDGNEKYNNKSSATTFKVELNNQTIVVKIVLISNEYNYKLTINGLSYQQSFQLWKSNM